YQDFRVNHTPLSPLQLAGADAADVTKAENEGFRITLTKKRKEMGRAGLQLKTPVKGDFEITSTFEILQVDDPTEGHGVGFNLYIEFDSPRHDVAEVGW